MKSVLLIIAILVFLSPHAGAATSKKAPLRWIESNGEIVLDSVCEEFVYGSRDYRNCRAAAKRLFEDRCRDYRQRVDRSGGSLREINRQKRDMYCVAASQFGAVN